MSFHRATSSLFTDVKGLCDALRSQKCRERFARVAVLRGVCALLAAVGSLSPAVALAGDVTPQDLKARDVRRALENQLLRYSQETPGGVAGAGDCFLEDADDDGMADSWESARGLDPGNPDDAWFDPDGDEVVNLFEFQLGGDPHNSTSPPGVTVAPSGADFSDVGQAIDGVAPGTVIRVAGGTYNVNYMTFSERVIMIQGAWSGDFSHRDLRQFPTTFDGRMGGEVLYFSNSGGNPTIILEGIHFVKGNGSFGAVNLLAQGTACMTTSIVNCSIMESTSDSFGGACNIHNWDSSESDRTIANTAIANNVSSAIYSQVTETGRGHWRIIHATISGNTSGGSNGHGIEAFTLDGGQLTSHIYNSIVWGNQSSDVDIRRDINFDADHSDIGSVSGSGSFNVGPGVVNLNPLFVDPGSGDYHLQETSLVRNAGTAIGIPLTDFEGDPRNSGGAPDMGAFEFQGACAGPDFDEDGTPDVCDRDIDDDGIPNVTDVCDFTPPDIPVDDQGRPRADLNLDCVVDLLDFAVFQNSMFGP